MTATQTRVVAAPPDKVFDVLSDGWLYPVWVVGATRMREVDEGWPATGTRLYHSVGTWPVMLNDVTHVESCDPGRRLVLLASGRSVGKFRVDIELRPHPEGTEVQISESAVSGLSLLVPSPLRNLGLKWRNVETLRRLAYICERRSTEEDAT